MEEWKTEKKVNKIDITAIIINTMIVVSNIEGRKMVDSKDLINFITTLQNECKKKDIVIEVVDSTDEQIKSIGEYVYPYKRGEKDTCYMILPWVKPAELYSCDSCTVPLELCTVLFNSFEKKMPQRDDESRKKLNTIYSDFVDNYISITEQKLQQESNLSKAKKLAQAKEYNNRV